MLMVPCDIMYSYYDDEPEADGKLYWSLTYLDQTDDWVFAFGGLNQVEETKGNCYY